MLLESLGLKVALSGRSRHSLAIKVGPLVSKGKIGDGKYHGYLSKVKDGHSRLKFKKIRSKWQVLTNLRRIRCS